MPRRTKFKPVVFLAFEYDREEEYLNSQAKKGWQLIKGGMLYHIYEKCDQEYRYKLDYNTKLRKNSDDYSRYLSFFYEQGWEPINKTTNGWHYFRKKYIPGAAKEDYYIYSDDTSLKEMLNGWIKVARAMQIYFILYLVLSLIAFINRINLQSGIEAFLSLLSITFMQVGILIMNDKKVNSKAKASLGIYSSYLMFGLILTLLSFMMYLLYK